MNDQIKLLKWMLEDERKVTHEGVCHLSKEQLFNNPIEGEYPIGAYLMHLGECDIHWLEILSGIKQPEDLKKRSYSDVWFDPFEISSPPSEPIELNEYIEVLAEARKNFLDYISTMKDPELEEIIKFKGKTRDREFSKKWIIYHILEHEAHHRGQMFMLIRKAGWNKIKGS